jgi:hypothetical protein
LSKGKVLLVCYDFPPVGGPAVGHPLALFKHLPQFGYECDVLTVKPVAYRVLEPELLDGLDISRIYRAGSYDPQRLMYLFGIKKVRDVYVYSTKRVSDRFFPDHKVGWVKPAVRMGRTLISNNGFNVVISTSPTISNHLVARQLSAESNTPWIADFRDFWGLYKAEETYQKRKQVERALSLLKEIQKRAAVITAVNPSVAAYVRANAVMYNSYDSDLAKLWRGPDRSDSFVIGLLGTLNEICPIEPLLKVLSVVEKSNPGLFSKIRLSQVGRVSMAWLQPQLERYRLTERIDIHRFRGREDSISIMSQSSLFYLGLPSPRHMGVTPGRIATLLASGRPILAAVPPRSEVEKIIEKSPNGLCFSNGSLSEAADYLCKQIRLFEAGKLRIDVVPEYARQYSSEKMVQRFAQIMDSLSRSGTGHLTPRED